MKGQKPRHLYGFKEESVRGVTSGFIHVLYFFHLYFTIARCLILLINYLSFHLQQPQKFCVSRCVNHVMTKWLCSACLCEHFCFSYVLHTYEKHSLQFTFPFTFGWCYRCFYCISTPTVPWNLTVVNFHFNIDISIILTRISLWKCKLGRLCQKFQGKSSAAEFIQAFAKNSALYWHVLGKTASFG